MNATTGVDNNGDRANDRPVIDGEVVGKSAFRGTSWAEVAAFAEERLPVHGRTILLRVEAFNLFNHANILGRNGVFGCDTATTLATFGQASPGLANIDPPRMVQLQVRYAF